MDADAPEEVGQPTLHLLASVRCLDCGEVYSKPRGGGTAETNPGCPTCGYVGWIALGAELSCAWQPRR